MFCSQAIRHLYRSWTNHFLTLAGDRVPSSHRSRSWRAVILRRCYAAAGTADRP